MRGWKYFVVDEELGIELCGEWDGHDCDCL
jgi:hypothetical protein